MSRRQRVLSIGVTAISSLVISIFLVHRFDTEPLGRLATMAVMGILLVCLVIAGVGLLIFRRTRWAGGLTLASALSILCVSNIGFRVSRSEGWIVSANSPAVSPLLKARAQVEANEIVYYKPGVTSAEMKSFEQAVLYRGSHLNPGITYFRRLGPSQAHGHDGFAIGIAGMSIRTREQLRTLLAESPLVFGVLHDKALDDVPDR